MINIRIPAKKTTIPIAFILGLSVSFILLLVIKNNKEEPWYYYLPVYCMLFIYTSFFTIVALLNYLKKIFDKHAALTITDSGLDDNLSIFSCGKISYSDISDVEVLKANNGDYLLVRLFDDDKYLAKKIFVHRYILKLFMKIWGSPVLIFKHQVDYNLEKIKEIISEHSQVKKPFN